MVYGWFKAFTGDNFQYFNDVLTDEPLIDEYKPLYFMVKMPSWLRFLLKTLLRCLGEKRSADLANVTQKISAEEMQHL